MTKKERSKIILVIICISFLQGLQFWVSPVLGQISKHYPGIDVSLVQMLITAPSIVSVFVALCSGRLVVKISKKRLLLFAALISGIAGIVPLLADSFLLLFLARMLYGVALGLSATLNTAVVADFFQGDERVTVMGIQGASIGAGMVCITTAAGKLGAIDFRGSYWVNLIGFLAFILIGICLPRKKSDAEQNSGKIKLNKEVYIVSAFTFLEFFFLITFTTNIAMHLSGSLQGSSTVSGSLTGIFSGIQIVAGLILGRVTKITKRFTMPMAMLSFSIGAVLLLLFPSNMPLLIMGAVFCGFSQGIFIPTGMVTVSNAVAPVATAMASAVFTCGMSLGQFLSPVCLNGFSSVLFGEATTGNVYRLSAVGMTVSALLAVIWQRNRSENGMKI
ncbi:MAG: MFS transporter [Lachnospiraceae bacterium]|nr:MFS transporter [Lachnospiraceae bacterium]